MAVMCDVCGKKPNYGFNISHAANKTARRWVPNIQSKRMMVDGEYRKVHICTRCLRTMSKTRA